MSEALVLADSLARALNSQDIFERNQLTPDDWQADLLRCESSRYLVCCSRQSGKSLTACALATHRAAIEPDQTIILISPSERQARENIRRCQKLLKGAGYGSEAAVENVTSLLFKNGSRILGLSSGGHLRGFTVDALIIDEAAYVADDVIGEAMPFLATRPNAPAICLSTPNGARGWFYKQFSDASNSWRKIQIPASMVARIPTSFLEEQRRELGEAMYRQEYECSFLEADTALFDLRMLAGKFEPLGCI